jgi:hypothetical protein
MRGYHSEQPPTYDEFARLVQEIKAVSFCLTDLEGMYCDAVHRQAWEEATIYYLLLRANFRRFRQVVRAVHHHALKEYPDHRHCDLCAPSPDRPQLSGNTLLKMYQAPHLYHPVARALAEVRAYLSTTE